MKLLNNKKNGIVFKTRKLSDTVESQAADDGIFTGHIKFLNRKNK